MIYCFYKSVNFSVSKGSEITGFLFEYLRSTL